MAQNVNSVVITGNLTRDPELRSTPSGTSVCSLRVAVNAREKIGGEWKDRANFFDVIVWGRQGESCAQYLAKGRPLAVQGKLRWREWNTNDGGKRQTVEIVADQVQFLGSREGSGGGDDGDYGYSGGGGGGGGGGGDDFGAGGGGDDFGTGGSEDVDSDIPF